MSFLSRFRKKISLAPSEQKNSPGPKMTLEKKLTPAAVGERAASVSTLRQPIISERASDLTKVGKYTFEVDTDANKISVKRDIRSRYSVTPLKVNIIKMKGKVVRFGRSFGRQRAWKKAIVTLKAGETIKEFSQT